MKKISIYIFLFCT